MAGERLLWIPADGSPAIDFTDESSGYSWEAQGTRGLRSLGYRFSAQTYAGVDGEEVQAIGAEANHPSVGLLVQARNPAEFQDRCRRLVHDLRPKAGPGTLMFTTPDGRSRRLRCYYEDGLQGDESDDTTMPGRWWKLILKLYAPKPWWLGDPITFEAGLGLAKPFFPFFPLRLAPSSVQGQFTVDLSHTDDSAHPVWTITGPGSALTLRNETTGREIVVRAFLAADERIVIDTRPGRQSVRRGDGTNLMSALASDPALWPLVDGVNQVTAAMTGATNASRIRGVVEPRYAGI
jgi:hypothetical protein